ncbi:MAG: hypothetical protein WBX38_17675 [Candidatus Sulfotelmatobacter sp.]
MPRTIDLIRASKLPSNMMQFAAKGALSVPPDECIEILVYLARHNKIFADLARMTLAGWDEKASLAAAADPKTASEVLHYWVEPDNLRPKLLPALLENPSVADGELAKLAVAASRETIDAMLKSARVRAAATVLDSLRSNPYVKAEEAGVIAKLLNANSAQDSSSSSDSPVLKADDSTSAESTSPVQELESVPTEEGEGVPDETVSAYLAEHAAAIAVEQDKPFHPVGGIVELLGSEYFPVSENKAMTDIAHSTGTNAGATAASGAATAACPAPITATPQPRAAAKRENSMQKINGLDVKGRIQLALKGNKEERSILIRDGTKVVALAVLEAPKLSDGEVEKFALQKNVLEAVLRQIPLKRRFMKNYIVVRNLVANPRTPLDLGLGLMKHLLTQDLKNISANKEVSETVRKLALKMYKQKLEAANKK